MTLGEDEPMGLTTRRPIRVFLVGGHPITRALTHAALADGDGIAVVGEVSDADDVLKRIGAEAADVAIVDLEIGGDALSQVSRSLRAVHPPVGVLLRGAAVLGHLPLAIAVADGLILYTTPRAELVFAIRNVYLGRPTVDRRIWPALFAVG